MSRSASSTPKTTSKPALKNPLRSSTMPLIMSQALGEPGRVGPDGERPAPEVTAAGLRQMQISEFCAWLRTQTNAHQRPFQEETISAYAETARALGLWMAADDIDGDFTACSTEVLNRLFAAYRNAHSQGGTNTRQRNLHHLFKWLALRYGHPDPWAGDLVRYGPVKVRPSTLAQEFIRDLLEVTGGGKATSFVDLRNHAMIRMLTEGVRREELAQQQITDLSENLIARPFVRVVPLKGARDFSEGRLDSSGNPVLMFVPAGAGPDLRATVFRYNASALEYRTANGWLAEAIAQRDEAAARAAAAIQAAIGADGLQDQTGVWHDITSAADAADEIGLEGVAARADTLGRARPSWR